MMDFEVRDGLMFIQKGSGLGKKFQKRWAVLFRKSDHGVSRLEVYDNKENYERRTKSGKKLIPLDNCATITRGAVSAGKKTEYQISLTFNDNKEQNLQLDDDEDMELWYQAMSNVIFGGGGLMDNVIYQQYEQEGYDVRVKENDMVKKQNLSGHYQLFVSKEDVELRDKNTKKVVTKWPLEFLRKYGRDKQEFSLEAGRRCVTGPGMFYFITDHYNEIFLDVDKKVKNLADRRRTHSTSSSKTCPSPTSKFLPDISLPPSPAPPPMSAEAEGEYDIPIDNIRGLAKRQPAEESIYNEPVDTAPSQKPKKKPASPKKAPKPVLAAPPKPDRAQNKKGAMFGGKKDKKAKGGAKNLPPGPPPPPHIEEATYSEAIPNIGLADGDNNAYGRLDFEGTAANRLSDASGDNQYDSLNVFKKPSATSNGESEYASADAFNQRLSGLSNQGEEGLYDHVDLK